MCRFIEYRLTNVLSLAVLMFASVPFALLSIYAPKRVHGAFGICGGSSTKLIDEIPTAVIKAASAYLKTDMEVGILSYAPPKDPKLEPIAQVHWGNLKMNGARFLGVVTLHSLYFLLPTALMVSRQHRSRVAAWLSVFDHVSLSFELQR